LRLTITAVSANLLAMLVFGWIVAFTAQRLLADASPPRVAAPVLR
jgi:hypothetical protein